jgi:hypothetical protein
MRLQTFSVNQMESLLANQQNRKLNGSWTKWHHAMLNGEWNPSLAPIILYTDGTLADGQHRIRAAIEVGKPFTCYVTVIEREDIVHVDAGRARSTADHCKILGLGMANKQVAMGRLCLAFELGNYGHLNLEHAVVIEACKRYNVSFWSSQNPMKFQTVVLGLCAFVAHHGADPMPFYRRVSTGVGLDVGDPELVLRNWILDNNTCYTGSGKGMRGQLIWRVTRCWNAHALGQKLFKMPTPKSGWSFLKPFTGKEAKDGQDASE